MGIKWGSESTVGQSTSALSGLSISLTPTPPPDSAFSHFIWSQECTLSEGEHDLFKVWLLENEAFVSFSLHEDTFNYLQPDQSGASVIVALGLCQNASHKLCSCAPCRLDPCCSHLSGLHGFWRELPSQPQYWHAAQVNGRRPTRTD